MKWISDLELTRGEKAILVSLFLLCFVETDIAPTMKNVGNFSIDFAKDVLRNPLSLDWFLLLDPGQNQVDATHLIEKVFGDYG